jgi:hypothetical protein
MGSHPALSFRFEVSRSARAALAGVATVTAHARAARGCGHRERPVPSAIGDHHAHYLQEQMEHGGLLLWVRTWDAEEESALSKFSEGIQAAMSIFMPCQQRLRAGQCFGGVRFGLKEFVKLCCLRGELTHEPSWFSVCL